MNESLGITYDTETGFFRIDNVFRAQIRIEGHGNRYAMVRKALQRNGILAHHHIDSDTYIRTDGESSCGFVIHHPDGKTTEVQTIEALLDAIHLIFR